MSLFAEAVRSAFLPCSFAILVPALVVTLLTRTTTRLATLGTFVVGASVLAWLPFLRVITPFDHNFGGAVALGIGIWILMRVTDLPRSSGSGLLIGAFAGATWIPCVGAEFGNILNTGLRDPGSAAIPLTIYIIGVLVPLLVVVAIIEFVPPVGAWVEHHRVRVAASALGVALAAIVLIGQYPTLLSELARRSSF